MKMSRLLGGVAAVAVLAATGSAAFAQSTGTQEVEKVTVTGQRTGTGGLIVKEKATKTRSTVDQTYLNTQASGQTIFQSLNLVPGLNFTNSDAYGSSGGNVRLRGFDGNRISLTTDGIPLNDTGNYAIFTNQQVDAEVIQRATVSTGSTDVDSPTASATGGTINVVTRKPKEETAADISLGLGSENYYRAFVALDTGETRDGLSAFLTYSTQSYDKFKGPGQLEKDQVNVRVLQEIGSESSISLIGHYNQNRNAFYRTGTNAQFLANPNFDNFASCTRDAANGTLGVNGLTDNIQDDAITVAANPGGNENILNPGSCTNYFGLRINPSNTGNLRAQMNFQLGGGLRLTIDPSWQYVKANGGGTTVVGENDPRVVGASGLAGFDLNGDGDILDIDTNTADNTGMGIRLYTPNNTNTSRFGVNTSLIYDLNDENRVRVSYTGDFGRHRQTGAFSRLAPDGNPLDVFGGLDGDKVATADGSFLRGRDRLSKANLNQVAVSYTGRFFEETLRVDLGVRAPFFKRELNQFCYSQNGSSNVWCSTAPEVALLANGNVTLTGRGALEYIRPFSTDVKYDAVLPNVGVSYEFLENTSVYGSYAESLSAPRTDSLYTVRRNPVTFAIEISNAEPERTKAYDLGLRYQGDELTVSGAVWMNKYDNRIVNAFDDILGIFVDRNVGAVDLQGVDLELGYRPTDAFTAYVSASFVESELKNDVQLGATSFLPTKGKALVETPDKTFSARMQYAIIPELVVGLQAKYVGQRWATDVNDERAAAYSTADMDVRFDLGKWGWEGASFQFNAINLFDKRYYGNIGTQTNALSILDTDPVTAGNQTRSGSAPTYAISAPQTFQIQLKAGF